MQVIRKGTPVETKKKKKNTFPDLFTRYKDKLLKLLGIIQGIIGISIIHLSIVNNTWTEASFKHICS